MLVNPTFWKQWSYWAACAPIAAAKIGDLIQWDSQPMALLTGRRGQTSRPLGTRIAPAWGTPSSKRNGKPLLDRQLDLIGPLRCIGFSALDLAPRARRTSPAPPMARPGCPAAGTCLCRSHQPVQPLTTAKKHSCGVAGTDCQYSMEPQWCSSNAFDRSNGPDQHPHSSTADAEALQRLEPIAQPSGKSQAE